MSYEATLTLFQEIDKYKALADFYMTVIVVMAIVLPLFIWWLCLFFRSRYMHQSAIAMAIVEPATSEEQAPKYEEVFAGTPFQESFQETYNQTDEPPHFDFEGWFNNNPMMGTIQGQRLPLKNKLVQMPLPISPN